MSARTILTAIAAIGVLTPTRSTARAADIETRVFTVLVDGRPAGEYRLAIRTADDGAETATSTAAVQVRYLLGGYHYTYRGTEVWKAGRLTQLDAASDDNGTKAQVRATAEGDGLRVVVVGQSQVSRPNAWPTTYWRLPQAKTGPVSVLDVDTGKVLTARLEMVGAARVTVAGTPMDATRYRVAGQAQADLWYDARGRMVRQETVEDGHKTIMELREIQR